MMSLVGTKNINNASTEEKIRTLARTKPGMARFLNDNFQSNVQFAEGEQGQAKNETSLDRYTRNAMVTLFSAEIQAENALASTLTPVSEGISGVKEEAVHQIQGVKENINKLLKPVSSATGATLGNLTNVLKDPLGAPSAIGQSVINLIDKVNPGFADSLDATFKKYKADELTNLPGQAIGSIRNLAALADSILSVPFSIAEDLYNGLMDIMQEIGDLVDSIMSAVFDLFFGPGGVVDSIIPLSMIQEFLDTLGEVASIVGGLSQIAGGFDQITNITSQVTSYTTQATSILNNPIQLAQQFVTPEIEQGMRALRDPQAFVEKLLPSSIVGQIQQMQNVPGLGFVGNLGYGVRGSLETLSQGVFTKMVDNFTDQLHILSPSLNKKTNTLPAHDSQAAHSPKIDSASTNPNIATVQGVPVQATPRAPIFSTNEAGVKQQENNSVESANSINLGAKTTIAQ
jgi:hypothetical protein